MYHFSGYTVKANNAVNHSIFIAQQLGHTYVGSENLLLGLLVCGIGLLPLPDILLLAVQIAAGAAFYIGGSAVLKIEIFRRILDLLKWIVKRKGRD